MKKRKGKKEEMSKPSSRETREAEKLEPYLQLSPDIKIHQEPAESLGQQVNNLELMEMLMVMR